MAIGHRNPKVYLQGAPFGRDLIHLDRQICRGLAVRLLTVVAAWVRKAQGRGWRMLVEMVALLQSGFCLLFHECTNLLLSK